MMEQETLKILESNYNLLSPNEYTQDLDNPKLILPSSLMKQSTIASSLIKPRIYGTNSIEFDPVFKNDSLITKH
jgi:hypothetical protein